MLLSAPQLIILTLLSQAEEQRQKFLRYQSATSSIFKSIFSSLNKATKQSEARKFFALANKAPPDYMWSCHLLFKQAVLQVK